MEEENKKKENAKFQVKMKVRLMVLANCSRETLWIQQHQTDKIYTSNSTSVFKCSL